MFNDRTKLLFGEKMEIITNANVMVVGIGGVGGYADSVIKNFAKSANKIGVCQIVNARNEHRYCRWNAKPHDQASHGGLGHLFVIKVCLRHKVLLAIMITHYYTNKSQRIQQKNVNILFSPTELPKKCKKRMKIEKVREKVGVST